MKKTSLVILAAVASIGCGRTPQSIAGSAVVSNADLDRATALRLAQQRGGKATTCAIVGSFPAEFQELSSAGIVVCQPLLGGQMICQMRNGGQILTTGRMTPTGVLGVTQTGPNSAEAVLQLSFQAEPVYQQHRRAVDTICGGDQSSKWNTSATATFQRFDDGWRLRQSTPNEAERDGKAFDEAHCLLLAYICCRNLAKKLYGGLHSGVENLRISLVSLTV